MYCYRYWCSCCRVVVDGDASLRLGGFSQSPLGAQPSHPVQTLASTLPTGTGFQRAQHAKCEQGAGKGLQAAGRTWMRHQQYTSVIMSHSSRTIGTQRWSQIGLKAPWLFYYLHGVASSGGGRCMKARRNNCDGRVLAEPYGVRVQAALAQINSVVICVDTRIWSTRHRLHALASCSPATSSSNCGHKRALLN